MAQPGTHPFLLADRRLATYLVPAYPSCQKGTQIGGRLPFELDRFLRLRWAVVVEQISHSPVEMS